MRKTTILAPLLVIAFFASFASRASEQPVNIIQITENSDLVISGECKTVTEKEVEILDSGGVIKKVLLDNAFLVEEVIADRSGVGVKAGDIFTFYTFSPPTAGAMTAGGRYTLFLDKYPFAIKDSDRVIWGYVGGESGFFKMEKAPDGKVTAVNPSDNKDTFFNVTPQQEKAMGLKGLPVVEKRGIKTIKGPIEFDSLKKVVKDASKGKIPNPEKNK